MTRQKWVASILIVYHVAALLVVSIPDPEKFPLQAANARSQPQALRSDLTLAIDAAARTVTVVRAAIYRSTGLLRQVALPYVAAGVGDQQWRMFSDPYLIYKYVRVDSHVGDRVYRYVVYPRGGDQRIRLLHPYRDKAISVAIERYVRAQIDSPSKTRELFRQDEAVAARRYFRPIARYFRNRLTESLSDGQHIVRTDVWYGVAEMPAPGDSPDAVVMANRLLAIEPYLAGPAAVPFVTQSRPPRLWTETEADVVWTLLYIDEP